MKGVIVNFRGSRHRQKDNHMVIMVSGVKTRKKAETLVGKKIEFKTQTGKTISGKVAAPHGNKGCVRAVFERGMPGQSLGKNVKVE